jgi:hypothetical protein
MTIEKDGFTLTIEQDPYPDDPRNWDNAGVMYCSHRNYNLGDEQFKANMFDSWDEVEEYLIEERQAKVILPLYLYDHSGITMNTTGFSCGWDSGRVGFIYLDKDTILKEWEYKKLTKERRKKLEDYLRTEVQTYDQYLTGDVYWYGITDENGELVDSCGGYYGEDDCLSEGESVLNYSVQQAEIERLSMVKL